MERNICSDAVKAQVFREARSQNRWLDRAVPDSLLQELYDLMKWGPTSMRVNFLCGLGYGDPAGLFPRHPRLRFEEACELL